MAISGAVMHLEMLNLVKIHNFGFRWLLAGPLPNSATKSQWGLSLGTSLSPHKPPPMWADIRRWKEVAILGAILSASDILAFKGSFCEKKSLPFNPSPKSLKSSSAELDSRNPSNAPLCRWPT